MREYKIVMTQHYRDGNTLDSTCFIRRDSQEEAVADATKYGTYTVHSVTDMGERAKPTTPFAVNLPPANVK